MGHGRLGERETKTDTERQREKRGKTKIQTPRVCIYKN